MNGCYANMYVCVRHTHIHTLHRIFWCRRTWAGRKVPVMALVEFCRDAVFPCSPQHSLMTKLNTETRWNVNASSSRISSINMIWKYRLFTSSVGFTTQLSPKHHFFRATVRSMLLRQGEFNVIQIKHTPSSEWMLCEYVCMRKIYTYTYLTPYLLMQKNLSRTRGSCHGSCWILQGRVVPVQPPTFTYDKTEHRDEMICECIFIYGYHQ